MATLRIQFPEKESPTLVAIAGDKVTIGRRADNTIQIVDRMVSAFHAEFILEGDHYRIHDLNSTNGTRINGDVVSDYHLKEPCKIGLGPVECEFSPEPAPKNNVEKLPTRIEVEAVRRENEQLEGRIATLEQEVAALTKVRDMVAN